MSGTNDFPKLVAEIDCFPAGPNVQEAAALPSLPLITCADCTEPPPVIANSACPPGAGFPYWSTIRRYGWASAPLGATQSSRLANRKLSGGSAAPASAVARN